MCPCLPPCSLLPPPCSDCVQPLRFQSQRNHAQGWWWSHMHTRVKLCVREVEPHWAGMKIRGFKELKVPLWQLASGAMEVVEAMKLRWGWREGQWNKVNVLLNRLGRQEHVPCGREACTASELRKAPLYWTISLRQNCGLISLAQRHELKRR